MNAERWKKVKELFDAVVELDPDDRNRVLDRACESDKALRSDVEKLLSSFEDSDGFLEDPAAAQVARAILETKGMLQPGERFGHYKILRQIGVGGMGRVYRAEQKALGRTVAVKIIHPHLLGEESASVRFITEARAASRLNHPNIVSVFDFGKSGTQLYLVMEFLRGKDLARVDYEEGPLVFRRGG